jgi:PIN domain nuclease of toxin-antitoxin system
MKIALDTNAFIWWFTRDPKLGAKARALIGDETNAVSCSAAVVWEIALRHRTGKLRLDGEISRAMVESGLNIVPILAEDAETSGGLEWPHSDPFDRMIVAQAMRRGETLVSSDRAILSCALLPVMDASG